MPTASIGLYVGFCSLKTCDFVLTWWRRSFISISQIVHNMFFSLPLDLREIIWSIVQSMRIDEIRKQMEKDRIERLSMIRRILLNYEWINYCEACLSQSQYRIRYVGDSSGG